ncbi:MAG: hypothetical protein A4E19_13660 [Nitrospira sp. SG-bin1]|nr:MAG: hypothetical protein A4E19_13660 [Nitrospira sp. SG-bin1]
MDYVHLHLVIPPKYLVSMVVETLKSVILWRLKETFAHGAPNRLQQRFVAAAPNRIWAGDLTAIPTHAGWMYLAVVLDLYSRRVIGLGHESTSGSAGGADGVADGPHPSMPTTGADSSQRSGGTYTSGAYQRLMRQAGLAASMSHRGNCYANAGVESFFSTLKNELVHDQDFWAREEAQAAVFEFIEVFYNRQRVHQTLGYISLVQCEAAYVP